jgi:protein-S-isoprenylcysteine O-methyltransferase Ste14
VTVGRWLFRARGWIGAAAAVLVLALGRPTGISLLFGLAPVLAGLAVRFWAMGYIGRPARSAEIGGPARVVSGPYRTLRHPLYIGNLLIAVGTLLACRVPGAVTAFVLAGFVAEYGLIALAEERGLRGAPEERPAFALGRALADWWAWLGCGIVFGAVAVMALVRA